MRAGGNRPLALSDGTGEGPRNTHAGHGPCDHSCQLRRNRRTARRSPAATPKTRSEHPRTPVAPNRRQRRPEPHPNTKTCFRPMFISAERVSTAEALRSSHAPALTQRAKPTEEPYLPSRRSGLPFCICCCAGPRHVGSSTQPHRRERVRNARGSHRRRHQLRRRRLESRGVAFGAIATVHTAFEVPQVRPRALVVGLSD